MVPLEPSSYKQVSLDPAWCHAMQEEYDALMANKTWVLYPRPVDHIVIDNKWVYKVKQTSTGEVDRFKARLEEVYMEQPKGFVNSEFPDSLCRLKKSLYGLKQALRAWFMKLSPSLLEFGFTSSTVNFSLFVYYNDDAHLFFLIYVDDILVTGTHQTMISSLISQLQLQFKMKNLGDLHFFLGIQAHRDSFGLHLRQTKYINDLLHRTKMAGAKPFPSPCSPGLRLSLTSGELLTANHVTEYRQMVGTLQYCTLTRPDISFSVNQLCQFMHCPTSSHWSTVKRVLRYFKGTIHHGLWYTKAHLSLQAFCDSHWARNPDDRRLTTGYNIFLGSCLVSWSAKKQLVVARSSTKAEYRALTFATAELYWIRMLLQALCIPLAPPQFFGAITLVL
ncbi:uncharacterized mitochondrial protein AtMg00810-like [Magnolia sinica]|uniref:uncharacterized mitochondrial protein AtMg00810-like n=1 Tax=Magnolia sinica TaxID=86752 RepID=UPI00265ABF53|nr:uncharacterized mitochondrial protein AtMg00810-like [Magnolia sinica]